MPWTLDVERTWNKLTAGDQGGGSHSPLLPQLDVRPVCTLWRDAVVLRLRLLNLADHTATTLDGALQQALRVPWEVFAFTCTIDAVTVTEEDVCEFLAQDVAFGAAVRTAALASTPADFALTYGHVTWTKDGVSFPLVGMHAALFGVAPEALATTPTAQRWHWRVHAYTALYAEVDRPGRPLLVVPAGHEADVLNGGTFAAAWTAAAHAQVPRGATDPFNRHWDGQWTLTCDATARGAAFAANSAACAAAWAGAAPGADGWLFDYALRWLPDATVPAAQQISFHLVVQFTLGQVVRFGRNVRYDFPLPKTVRRMRLCELRPFHLDWSKYTVATVNGSVGTDCWSSRTALGDHPVAVSKALVPGGGPTSVAAAPDADLAAWCAQTVAYSRTPMAELVTLLQQRYFYETQRTADWPDWEADWEADRAWLEDFGGRMNAVGLDVLDRQRLFQQLDATRVRLLQQMAAYGARGMLTADEVTSYQAQLTVQDPRWAALQDGAVRFAAPPLPAWRNVHKEQLTTGGASAAYVALQRRVNQDRSRAVQHDRFGGVPVHLGWAVGTVGLLLGVGAGVWGGR